MASIQQKTFTDALRRVLYLSQILQYNLDSLKDTALCMPYLKEDANRVKNSIRNMFGDIMIKFPEDWARTKEQLKGDKVHNLSLLLQAMEDVDNVEEITNVINSQKTALIEEDIRKADGYLPGKAVELQK